MSVLNSFDISELVHFVAKIGLLMEMDNGTRNTKFQLQLADELLPSNAQLIYRVYNLVRDASARQFDRALKVAPLITPMHVLFLLKLIVLNHNYLDGARIQSRDDCQTIFRLLLATGEHMNCDEAKELEGSEGLRRTFSYLIRNGILLNRDDAANLIGRFNRLLFELPKTSEVTNSIGDRFESATGVNLRAYFSVGIALAARFAPASISNYINNIEDPNQYTFLVWKDYFALCSLDEDLKTRLYHLFCISIEQARAEFADDVLYAFEYDLRPFVNKPILQLPSGIAVVGFLPLLIEKFTSGVYWTILDSLTDKEKGLFRNDWGWLCQKYVEDLVLNDLLPKTSVKRHHVFFDKTYRKSKSESRASDVIVYDETTNELFLFEITFSSIRLEVAMQKDNRASLSDGVDKLVQKARQLDSVIMDLRKGTLCLEGVDPKRIKVFRPYIITLNSLPTWGFIWRGIPDVWEGIDSKIKSLELLRENDIASICLLSFGDLENLAEIGGSFLRLLRQWSKSPRWKGEPFRNFLAGTRCKYRFRKTSVVKSFSTVYEEAEAYLFA
ncbi:MAG: hypothetical protein IPP57_23230 [Candidatus Obscuribacter sp.]|nr:hypothetical protein [Candidatus Obscuribacter sp.]